MAKARRYAFNAGEWAPELHYRSDLERYYAACRELTNYLVTPYGAVRRRPGLEAIADVSTTFRGATDDYRLIPFEYSEDTTYLLVLRETDATPPGSEILVLSPAGVLKDTVAAPWAPGDFYRIQYVQSNDVMYLTHPDYPPQRLARNGDTDWSLSAAPVLWGPYLPVNTDPECALTPVVPEWSSGTTYARGDMVCVPGDAKNLTGNAVSVFWYQTTTPSATTKYYLTRFTTDRSHGYRVGDCVLVAGVATGYNGQWTIIRKTSTTFDVLTGLGAHANQSASSGTVKEVWGELYESILDANVNQDPETEDDYWREVHAFRGTFTLQASKATFTEEWEGGRVLLHQARTNYVQTGTLAADATSTPVSVSAGSVRLTTVGTWTGTVELQESVDGQTWEPIATVSSGSDTNTTLERTASSPASQLRLWMKALTSGTFGFRLEVLDTDHACHVLVTAFVDTTHVTCVTENYIANARYTVDWAEGAWSPKNGYPRAVTIYNERLTFGGNLRRPQTVWFSAVNDWPDFDAEATLSTSALSFSLASDSLNRVQWLVPKTQLIIGTDAGEWTLGSRDDTQGGISSTNVAATRHTEYGSAPIRPMVTSDVVMFLERNGLRLRGMHYDYELDGFKADDLTAFAPHVLAAGAREIAFQRSPQPIIWVVCEDGSLASFTFDRENQVLGWARHETECDSDEGFVSVCALPGTGGDDVYCLVERYGVVYLEAMRGATSTLAAAHLDWRQATAAGVQVALFTDDPGFTLSVWADGRQLSAAEYTLVGNKLVAVPDVVDGVFLTSGGVARDAGSGKVGLPAVAHGFEIGDTVYVGGTTHYDGSYTVATGTSTDELVVVATYEAETFGAGAVAGSPVELVVGADFESVLQPTAVANPGVEDGGPGRVTRVTAVDLWTLASLGGEISVDGGVTWETILSMPGDHVPGDPLPLFSGMRGVRLNSGHRDECDVRIRTSDPYPLTVLCMGVRVRRYDD